MVLVILYLPFEKFKVSPRSRESSVPSTPASLGKRHHPDKWQFRTPCTTTYLFRFLFVCCKIEKCQQLCVSVKSTDVLRACFSLPNTQQNTPRFTALWMTTWMLPMPRPQNSFFSDSSDFLYLTAIGCIPCLFCSSAKDISKDFKETRKENLYVSQITSWV
jgi:hypothetical protein